MKYIKCREFSVTFQFWCFAHPICSIVDTSGELSEQNNVIIADASLLFCFFVGITDFCAFCMNPVCPRFCDHIFYVDQGWTWNSMAYCQFLGQIKTMLPPLFWEMPYQRVTEPIQITVHTWLLQNFYNSAIMGTEPGSALSATDHFVWLSHVHETVFLPASQH